MKKLLATGGGALLVLAAGLALAHLPRSPRTGEPELLAACASAGALQAGAAVVPLSLPAPVTLGGFPRWSFAAEGQRDPVAVRALVLRSGGPGGCALGFVSAEILVVPGALSRAVEAGVADLGLSALLMGATHTHAGPGGYWDSALAARLATGPYDPTAFTRLAAAAEAALRQAAGRLRPARLSAGQADEPGLVLNRSGGQPDGRLVSLRLADPAGAPIGELALLGAHPTMLGKRNRQVSGDWPGALMRGRTAPLLFFQGALGDQSVRAGAPEEHSPEGYAAAVARRLEAVRCSAPDPAPAVAVGLARVPLPRLEPGGLPWLLRPAAGRLLEGALPAVARVAAVRLGPLLLLAVPAEPVEEVARGWRAAAGPGAELLALAGDYDGYVETPARVEAGRGEAVRAYYGPALAARLESALAVAVRAARAVPGQP